MATSYAHFSKYSEVPYSTDHWSKLRVKSFRRTQLPSGNVTVLCAPKVPHIKQRRHSLNISELQASRCLSRAGSARLHNEITNQLPPLNLSRHFSVPSLKHGNRPTTTAASDRARTGFKYWLDENSKQMQCGTKVTMGSKGTYLGVGVPRL